MFRTILHLVGAHAIAAAAACNADSSIDELCCAETASSISDAESSGASCCIQGPAIQGPESCAPFPGFGYSSPCADGTCKQCCRTPDRISGPLPSRLSTCPSTVSSQFATCDTLGVCGVDANMLTEGHNIHWHCILQYGSDKHPTEADCPGGWRTNGDFNQCVRPCQCLHHACWVGCSWVARELYLHVSCTI